MFNLGFQEILFIGVLALVIIGPKDLPSVARVVGRALNDLKRATEGFKDEFSKTKFLEHEEKPIQKPMANSEELSNQSTNIESQIKSVEKNDNNRDS